MTITNNTTKINLKDLIRTEYSRCQKDPVYFMKKYCMIQHPKRGRLLFDLYPYQENSLDIFQKQEYAIVLKGRQIGLSTVVACYALWMMLFFKDKNVLVIATKQETAKNLIIKVRFAFDNLPIWLQVPCIENNKLSLRFKNGSQIKASSSSGDAGRSEAVSLLVLDEAAFIKNAEEIWTAAQATLATGGKAILISTPNGIGNFFYKKYIEAEEYKDKPKDGIFYPIKLDWSVHPERDQRWKEKQLAVMGPRDFRQEYEAEFLGSGNTVIDADVIGFYRETHMRDPVLKSGPGGDLWTWEQPDYTKSYIVTVDVARGETADTGDFSAIHVLDALNCAQVAEFKGRIPTTDLGHLAIGLATLYNDALLVVENGGIGWATVQTIMERGYKNLFYMTEDMKYVDPDEIRSNKLYRLEKKAVPGFTTSTRTRPLIISKLDTYMRDKAVIIRSKRTIDELMTFIWENGKPIAADGFHDDLLMSLAIALWIRDTALQLHERGLEYTRLSLDKITKVSSHDPVYGGRTRQGADPYNINIGGVNHDLRWLL
jgi:hypothetical protein